MYPDPLSLPALILSVAASSAFGRPGEVVRTHDSSDDGQERCQSSVAAGSIAETARSRIPVPALCLSPSQCACSNASSFAVQCVA